MKLLLSQYRPAIRLFKWAKTLKKLGYDVTILSTNEPVSNIDFSEFKQITFEKYKDYSKEYDLHLSFNTNVKGLSVLPMPTIQVVGDLKVYYTKKEIEKQALSQALKCVFVSEIQMKEAIKYYPEIKHKSSVVINGIIEEQKQNKDLTKLNNGFINLVYSGTISDKKENHRYFIELFNYISNTKKIKLHIYASALGLPDIYKSISNIEIHDTVNPMDLIQELTRYDVGLIYWKDNKDVADSSLPNKLFEYLQANIPIVAEKYKQLEMFNENKNVIGFFNNFEEIERVCENICIQNKNKDIKNHCVTYEGQISEINKILSI